MRNKIIKSLLVVVLLITIGLSYNLIVYKTTQDYSAVAANQFTDDNSYYTLKTQKSTNIFIDFIYGVSIIGSFSLFYFIWKPKKEVELDDVIENDSTELKEDVKEDVKEV